MKMAFNKSEEMDVRIAAIDALGEIISHSQERTLLAIGPLRINRNDYKNKIIFRMAEGFTHPDPEIRQAIISALKK